MDAISFLDKILKIIWWHVILAKIKYSKISLQSSCIGWNFNYYEGIFVPDFFPGIVYTEILKTFRNVRLLILTTRKKFLPLNGFKHITY